MPMMKISDYLIRAIQNTGTRHVFGIQDLGASENVARHRMSTPKSDKVARRCIWGSQKKL
jgi:hypothetical protein